LANHCGQEVKKVHNDTERDRFMTGEEAKTYGLIDNVIAKRVESKELDAQLTGSKAKKKEKDDK